MSLTLTAFPLAFLINPSKCTIVNLTKLAQKHTGMLSNNENKLYEIKILTNLTHSGLLMILNEHTGRFMQNVIHSEQNTYTFKNGLKLKFEKSENYYNVILSGNLNKNDGLKFAEGLFNIFDEITLKNVRDVGGCEKFYYQYKTDYSDISVLKKELRKNDIFDISQISDNELSANIDGKNIRFYKNKNNQTFSFELEQKISLMNIGVSDTVTDVEIKTNIKPDELKPLLNGTMYNFDSTTSSIRLNCGNIPVKFELNDGMYTLKFGSKNITSERREIEELFVTMNKRAKRDLRLVKDKSYVNYSYKTNYTDKGVLINTLLEHGAKNLFEEDGNIYCELYDMQMTYKQLDENSSYILEIAHVQDKDNCATFIKDMNDEYGLNMQEITYRKITERLRKENLNLESEEIEDDNSIVLTIDVG